MLRSLVLLFTLSVSTPALLTGDRPAYPQNYFRSPVGIPIALSGGFAEMRSNHFHSGIDIKTNGKIGYRIYAAADGWVSRIAVSPTGFGHALYIAHPNGYTTVYAHLDSFKEPVASYVRRQQYAQQSFRVNLYPERNQFRVSKGDVIALSGNSGSSGGPHLHFEIRDSATQEPINPWLFGFDIQDTQPPRIFRVKLYAAEPSSVVHINHRSKNRPSVATFRDPVTVEVAPSNGRYVLQDVRSIEAQGRVGFSIQTHDYHNPSQNRLGAYIISLSANGQTLYRSEMERFSFDETRYLNAHIDYAVRQNQRRWFQRSHLLPGNRLRFYETEQGGFLSVTDGETYALEYDIEDVAGNISQLRFSLAGTSGLAYPPNTVENMVAAIRHGHPEIVEQPGLRAEFPANIFYEDVPLTYDVKSPRADSYSERHVLHSSDTPIHRNYTLSIRPEGLPANLRDKALIARENDRGRASAVGGSYENGMITAKTRSFGTFFVTTDTEAPRITPVNITNNKDMRRNSAIRIKIADDLSGIQSYAGYINDQWVLFAYDAKNALLEYTFDDYTSSGWNDLRLVVRDNKGNRNTYTARFRR